MPRSVWWTQRCCGVRICSGFPITSVVAVVVVMVVVIVSAVGMVEVIVVALEWMAPLFVVCALE